MIKVKVRYAYEHHKEKVYLEFEDGTTQEKIDEEIEGDFLVWVTNYADSGGWEIESMKQC